MYLLEVCVDSVESAIAAEKGGADRLELCGSLMTGGVTPPMSLFHAVKNAVTIPIHVLMRPRFGDFCYTPYEFEMLREDVRTFHEEGAKAAVIGVLTEDGDLDVSRMETLMDDAAGMRVTLHRAFDVCADPLAALETAKALGVRTILTSGQQNTCMEGRTLLTELARRSGDVEILAGGGVNADVIAALAPGIHSFHMSGKKTVESPMRFRREGVTMGLPLMNEYSIWRTDREEIARARRVLDSLEPYR